MGLDSRWIEFLQPTGTADGTPSKICVPVHVAVAVKVHDHVKVNDFTTAAPRRAVRGGAGERPMESVL
jgi:hypothetical protein